MKLKPEEAEQVAFMSWLRAAHPVAWQRTLHIANERKSSWQRGKVLKAMGVKPGVSDIFMAIPVGGKPGCWIEMKAPKGGKPTDTQVEWLRLMEGEGYAAHIAYGAEQAIDCAEQYLRGVLDEAA